MSCGKNGDIILSLLSPEGITTVLTLTTLSMDTRTDLPKVPYATALDMFVIMCFVFVTASMLEFAGVHYFTKLGSGEVHHGELSDEEEEEAEYGEEEVRRREWEQMPSRVSCPTGIEECLSIERFVTLLDD